MELSLYLQAFLYTLAGIWHLVKPKFYYKILPPPLSENPKFWVLLSGVAEIILGIGLLFQTTRYYAVWGIIWMLIAFLWVHIYMLTPSFKGKLPRWGLWLRLVFQLVLIYWAYTLLVI